jgi:hypothetical protein
MNQIGHKRMKLIGLINKYLSQSHIIIKRQLTDHKQSLEDGNELKPQHLSQMVPLLVWDMKMNHQQVTDYFSCLVSGGSVKSTKDPQTLDKFFN